MIKIIVTWVMGFMLASCMNIPIQQNPPIIPVTPEGEPAATSAPPKQSSLSYGFIPFSEEVSPDLEIGTGINFHFASQLHQEGIRTVPLSTQPPINYQMAESPEVTIEPVGEDAVKQQLQTVSTTEKLTGIIFGHIMQDLVKDTVYVIARVYLVNNPGHYQTFGHEDTMGIPLSQVSPQVIQDRLAQIAQQIKGWLKGQQAQAPQQPSSAPPVQPTPVQPSVVSPPAVTTPQEPPKKDIVDELGGSELSQPQPSNDVVELLGGESE